MRRISAGTPGAVCPGLFAEKVIEWLYWDIPQFGVLRSRTLLARAEALSCYANVASRFLVLTRTPCVQPWLASSSHVGSSLLSLHRRCASVLIRLLWHVSTALDERAKESGADSARCTLHALRTLVTLATTGYSAQGSARGCHLRRTPEQDGPPHLQQQPRLRFITAAQLFGAALRFPARRNPSRDDDC